MTSGEAGLCLDDSGGSGAAGNVIDVWQCLGDAAQSWAVWDDGTVRTAGGCLAVSGAGAAAGTPVVLEPCTPGAGAETWASGSGNSLVNPASGDCLQDPGSATADGTQVQIGACGTTA
ncbi:MAG TPA: ricin-type beta-trefoil lectin domain protein, partial [Streptosporangiaceae bacterium]|nr:ricin-type beta-trefoil lectin domain protein [Streptosporangiaceae bacterium]